MRAQEGTARRYAKALRMLKIKHLRTEPYTPKTNGKAERFVQTSLREWAYAQAYLTSDHRAQHLPGWLHRYNWHRPHSSLKSKPPISDSNWQLPRVGLAYGNLNQESIHFIGTSACMTFTAPH